MKPVASIFGSLKQHSWLALLAVSVCLVFFPVGYWASRICLVASSATLWLWGVFLLRRHRLSALAILVAGIAIIGWLCLPGRSGDPDVLRRSYVLCLKQYEGTRYVWGGENRLGIDCSGLVRRGLINANIKTGILTLNPQLVRTAMSLWWNDCSARALSDGYRGFTARIAQVEKINDIPLASLSPGDLAVTADGAHVLAYMGEKTWIEADPNVMKVITVAIPSEDMWFKTPVQIVRWNQLQKTQEDKSPSQRIESQVAQENRLPSGETPSVPATPTSTSIGSTNCVTPQGVRQDLLAQLRDKKLYKWFLRDSSSEHAKELGRVCLQSNLSREEIIALMGPPLFGGGSNGVVYSFAPSQLLEFQFDEQGKIIGAKVTGVPIQPK